MHKAQDAGKEHGEHVIGKGLPLILGEKPFASMVETVMKDRVQSPHNPGVVLDGKWGSNKCMKESVCRVDVVGEGIGGWCGGFCHGGCGSNVVQKSSDEEQDLGWS